MAGNTVSISFAGDSSSLDRAFSSVGSSAQKMAGDLDKAEGKSRSFGSAMDRAGEAADGSESKFMGAADLLDGLGGAFGLPTEGATGMMRAFGDLSGGFATLQPMIGGVTSLFSGMGATLMTPPMGIILLIAGLAAALVIAYQKSETFRDIVKGAFDVVKRAAEGLWNFFKDLPGNLLGIAGAIKDALIWPYKTAFNAIAGLWNDTVGKLSFSVPDWVPGIGGKGFSMPKLPTFHTGGLVPGPTGTPVPIMALAGETVLPINGGRAPGGGTIQIIMDGQVIARVVRNEFLRQQRTTPLGFAS